MSFPDHRDKKSSQEANNFERLEQNCKLYQKMAKISDTEMLTTSLLPLKICKPYYQTQEAVWRPLRPEKLKN